MASLRWVFGRTNVVRMSGVAVIGLVMTLVSWLGMSGYFQGDREVFHPEAWLERMEFGVLVMCFALVFVAVGLLMGLPDVERERERSAPPADHWS